MPRKQQPSQQSYGSGRQPPGDNDPEDRKPEQGDERIGSAHKLREEEEDDDDDEEEEEEEDDEDGDGEDDGDREHRLSRLPGREEEAEMLAEADIMEVLDRDDLKHMDGPDA